MKKSQQEQPFLTVPIKYETKEQYAKQESKDPLLYAKGEKYIQQVCGKVLFLVKVIDSTLLCPIYTLPLQSSKPIE